MHAFSGCGIKSSVGGHVNMFHFARVTGAMCRHLKLLDSTMRRFGILRLLSSACSRQPLFLYSMHLGRRFGKLWMLLFTESRFTLVKVTHTEEIISVSSLARRTTVGVWQSMQCFARRRADTVKEERMRRRWLTDRKPKMLNVLTLNHKE